MNIYGRPTAAELVAAVADFLDNDVRSSTEGQVNFHARVAANVSYYKGLSGWMATSLVARSIALPSVRCA